MKDQIECRQLNYNLFKKYVSMWNDQISQCFKTGPSSDTHALRGPVRVPYCCRLYLRLGDLSRSSR